LYVLEGAFGSVSAVAVVAFLFGSFSFVETVDKWITRLSEGPIASRKALWEDRAGGGGLPALRAKLKPVGEIFPASGSKTATAKTGHYLGL
jgi:hypothetical protein